MKKSICLLAVFILAAFVSFASASLVSEALVTQGRAALFNNGTPTCTGVVEANGYFQDAVTADPTDQEARLFYALTQLAVFGLVNGSDGETVTALDMLEAFGISRTAGDSLLLEPIYTDPPEFEGVYLPPSTVPGGTEMVQFLNTECLDLVDGALVDLAVVVDQDLNLTITALETGDTSVEVDWGDVLLFNCAVKTVKSLLLTVTAYDLIGIDTARLIQLLQADIFQIQRDLLDQYPDVLSLVGGGVGGDKLVEAKGFLVSAIDDFESAVTFITAETDNQLDDLISFNEEDINEVFKTLAYLTETRNSLNEDRVAIFNKVDQSWRLTDASGRDLWLDFSINMGFSENESIWASQTTPAFNILAGTVTRLEIDGNNIQIDIDAWADCGYAPITFEGTLNDQLGVVSGTWVQNLCGSYASGSFTGARTWYSESNKNIDGNAVYGSARKEPLDIRDVLPDFNVLNEPVAGTFREYPSPGSPVLNGILPVDYVTNHDLILDMNLQPAGMVTIPELPIILDGDDSDWSTPALMLSDMIGEDDYWSDSVDIEKAYLAKDSQYLYVAMKFANGTPFIPSYEWQQINYNLNLRTFPGNTSLRQLNISAGYDYNTATWEVNIAAFQDGTWQAYEGYGADSVAIGTDFIEFKVPLSVIEAITGGLSGKYLTFKTADFYGRFIDQSWSQDNNITLLQVDPGITLTGDITTDSGASGNIIAMVMANPERVLMADVFLDVCGTYTFPTLSATADEIVFSAFQDLDGNGIWSFGEPFGVQVLNDFTVNQTCDLALVTQNLLSVVDFNGDRSSDIFWRNYSTGVNYLWYFDGLTYLGGASVSRIGDTNWQIVGLADFNQDSHPDILWRNTSTGDNYVWYMDDNVKIGGHFINKMPDTNWHIVGVSDFNGDTHPDLLWRNMSTGANYLWYLDDCTRIGTHYVATLSDTNWHIVGTADFNSDSHPDILWRNYSTGKNYIYYMNDWQKTGSHYVSKVTDVNWAVGQLSDFNSDGQVDILWRNQSTGDNYVWYLNDWQKTGGSTFKKLSDLNWYMAEER